MIRRAIHRASRSTRVRDLVTHTPVTRGLVDRFVAGVGPADALTVAAALVDDGILATVDRLGEGATERAAATDTTEAYLYLLDLAERAGIVEGLDLSLKLSAVGQAIPRDGGKIAYDNAAEVCARAEALGATVTLDMEDHTTTDATLATLVELRRDAPRTGVAVQAQLRRTPVDCRDLARPGLRVRLCKGAYREPASVAFDRAAQVRISYASCLGILMSGPGYPMVATHDPALVQLTGRLAARLGRSAGSFEYQMLYGVRPDEQRRLTALGDRVRVYIPYGPDWYGYLLRRLAEKPANLLLLLRALGSRR